MILNEITGFLEENNKMNTHQHAFRAGRSCLSQLLGHYDSILEMLEHNKNADVVYLDFRAAFDKVDHGILLHKLTVDRLEYLGIWEYGFIPTSQTEYSRWTVVGPLHFLIL